MQRSFKLNFPNNHSNLTHFAWAHACIYYLSVTLLISLPSMSVSLLLLLVFLLEVLEFHFSWRFKGRCRQWVSIGPLVLEYRFILTQWTHAFLYWLRNQTIWRHHYTLCGPPTQTVAACSEHGEQVTNTCAELWATGNSYVYLSRYIFCH